MIWIIYWKNSDTTQLTTAGVKFTGCSNRIFIIAMSALNAGCRFNLLETDMKKYDPNRIISWLDLILICLLSWVIVIAFIVFLPDVLIGLMR